MDLSNREKRLLRLLLQESEYRPAIFFQEKLEVSRKTIYNDLKHLEGELVGLSVTVVKKPRNGTKLIGSKRDKESLQKQLIQRDKDIDVYAPEFRKAFIFANYLFSPSPMNYREFATYFFISYQSIKKDVDDILQFCKQQKMESKLIGNELQLFANESEKQKIFKIFCEKLIASGKIDLNTIDCLFSKEVRNVTKSIVEEIVKKLSHSINNYFIHSLEITFNIFLSRICLGIHVEKEENLIFDELKRMKFYMIATNLSKMIDQQLNCKLLESDLQYLCSQLLAHGIEPHLQVSSEQEELVESHIQKMIQKMSQFLEVDLLQDSLLLQALLSHIIPMMHRLNHNIMIKNPLLSNIKKQYATMFTLIKYAIADFEKMFSLDLTEDEISFLTIHFQLAFEKVQVTNHLLIVCNSGMATSELIFNRIVRLVRPNTIIENISEKKLNNASLDEVDLIISTIPLDDVAIPVIYVSALPTDEEIAVISSEIFKLTENEKNFHSKKYQSPALLEKFIDIDFLFVNPPLFSKEAILNFLAEDYLQKDLVTDTFKQSLFNREMQGTTGMKTGVAIPHAEPQTVKKTKVSIVTLSNPVQWENTPVSLVILLAISEENLSEAKGVIASIYELLNSQKAIQWLVDSQNKEELYSRLLRKEW